MENFKNYLEKKNIEEITIFLKNSPVDLLKTIGKRYRLPVSTKKKELIVQDIVRAVESDAQFTQPPPIHVMTISQLRNKARELNIDFSKISLKQDLRLAVIKKMKQTQQVENGPAPSSSVQATSGFGAEDSLTNDMLQSKTLPYLKALAKKYKIKVSKLSKNQLITLILESQVAGEPSRTLDTGAEKDLSKLAKNELIVLALDMGIDYKGKKKTDLIRMIKNARNGDSVVEGQEEMETTMTIQQIESVPIDKALEKMILANKKITVSDVKKILDKFDIAIPKGTKKRVDLIHLLTLTNQSTSSSSVVVAQSPPPSSELIPPATPPSQKTTTATPVQKTRTVSQKTRKQAEVIPQSMIERPPTQTSNRRKTPIASDIVSLDDIQSPFSPVRVGDLLEEPTEKQLQEELYRCLEFYEYPK